MKVLTLGGTRLLELVELAVAAWVYDSKNGKKRVIQQAFGWTSNCENVKYCVTGWVLGEKWESGIQLSRFVINIDEAMAMLRKFALTNQVDYFYNENNEFKLKATEEKLKETKEKLKTTQGELQVLRQVQSVLDTAEYIKQPRKKEVVDATVTPSPVPEVAEL